MDTTGFMPVVLQLLPNKLWRDRDTTGFMPVVRHLLPNKLWCDRDTAGLMQTLSKRAWLVDIRLKLKYHRHEAGGVERSKGA